VAAVAVPYRDFVMNCILFQNYNVTNNSITGPINSVATHLDRPVLKDLPLVEQLVGQLVGHLVRELEVGKSVKL